MIDRLPITYRQERRADDVDMHRLLFPAGEKKEGNY